MKKITLLLFLVSYSLLRSTAAVLDNYVEIVYNGTSATVNVASNISQYVTVSSGTSSHVKIVQSAAVDATNVGATTLGEIYYKLSGTSTDGEFYMEGAYKATVILNGLTLTNPSGPAINIQNGKRTAVSITNGTTSTLTDGVNADYNGCFHSKGHTKFKGKGTLNVYGKSRHGIYSKEYVEMKNCTLNIKEAVKDAIHCQEYFLMESGTLNISGAQDDGIQVEYKGSYDAATGTYTSERTGEISATSTIEAHEDENSANFYQSDGTLTISGVSGYAIKVAGTTIRYDGGTQNFDTANTLINADETTSIVAIEKTASSESQFIYDLNGRRIDAANLPKGISIVKTGNSVRKVFIR